MKHKTCMDCTSKIPFSTRSGRCKNCYAREYMKTYDKTKIETRLAVYRARFTDEEWRERGRQRTATWRLKHADDETYYQIKRKYGIDKAAFIKLYNEQKQKCPICKDDLALNSGKLHVDHDHQTGRVRGILCYRCNVGLGSFRDNPHYLRTAARYLGLKVPTCHPNRRVSGYGLCNTCYRAKLRENL